MKTWLKRSLIGLAAIVTLGGLTACGHREHRHEGMANVSAEKVAEWRGRFIERAGKELQLDEAQKQSLGVLYDKMNEQRLALAQGESNPRALMQQLVAGEKFDRTRANAFVAEKTAAIQGKSPEVVAAAADFYDGLKPEQQAKVRDLMSRKRGWGGWRG